MKKTIEIECPEGYKPVYCAETGNIQIVPENSMYEIKTYEDVRKKLGYLYPSLTVRNESSIAIAKLHTILDALNEEYDFDLVKGKIWYPWVRFYRTNSVPENATVIGFFRYKGDKYALVGGYAYYGGGAGLGAFNSDDGVGYAASNVGILTCKSEEIAKYVSTQFGKLVFEACFARHFKNGEFEWVDKL